jgi:hypothetical protein
MRLFIGSIILIVAITAGAAFMVGSGRWGGGLPQAEERGQPVNLYYYNIARDVDDEGEILCSPAAVLPVSRRIAAPNLIEDAIRQLISGELTEEERGQGFTTDFPHPDFDLISSQLKAGVLTLTFTEVPGFTTGGACRVGLLRVQVERTALQFAEVNEVVIVPDTIFQP